jgi:hypothetical protein
MAIRQGKQADWKKSSYSKGDSECVEVASPTYAAIAVRDSKDPHGPVLAFSPESWSAFVVDVENGQYNIG